MLRRPRRLRTSDTIRNATQENFLNVNDLVLPIFLKPGKNVKEPISSLPGVYRLSLDLALKEISDCIKIGLKSFALFPVIPNHLKNSKASEAYNPEGLLQVAIQEIKNKFSEVCLYSDVALDPYSSDGHDGLVKNNVILNDETIEVLQKQALSLAKAGTDFVSPSDMMDGRVLKIRKSLDSQGFTNTGIMSYTAKYASKLYGPFREALDSAPRFGDKKTYQMNPANSDEALLEAKLDFSEGADIMMVKPAGFYLDIIHRLKENFLIPIAAYQVSGEYAMIKTAAKNNWLDGDALILESLLSIKRAGAKIIFTYAAKDVANFLETRE